MPIKLYSMPYSVISNKNNFKNKEQGNKTITFATEWTFKRRLHSYTATQNRNLLILYTISKNFKAFDPNLYKWKTMHT